MLTLLPMLLLPTHVASEGVDVRAAAGALHVRCHADHDAIADTTC